MKPHLDTLIETLCLEDPRYHEDAYDFVLEALSFTQYKFRRKKHVTGKELLEVVACRLPMHSIEGVLWRAAVPRQADAPVLVHNPYWGAVLGVLAVVQGPDSNRNMHLACLGLNAARQSPARSRARAHFVRNRSYLLDKLRASAQALRAQACCHRKVGRILFKHFNFSVLQVICASLYSTLTLR